MTGYGSGPYGEGLYGETTPPAPVQAGATTLAKGRLVKRVNRDPSAESEATHFRRQLVRRPWDH